MTRRTQIILYSIGIIFMPLGVILTINAHLGANGYDALNFILAERLGISTGIAIYTTAGIVTIITALIRRGFPRLKTYISAILLGVSTDIWKPILKNVESSVLMGNLIIFFLGMLIIGIAVAAYMLSGFPTNPTDDFVVALKEKGWPIRNAKILLDGICVTLAFALGGEIGIMTIVITFGLGPIINVIYNQLEKIVIKTPVVSASK